jgi:hypothetical protein
MNEGGRMAQDTNGSGEQPRGNSLKHRESTTSSTEQPGESPQIQPLVGADEATQFRSRWDAIQTGFVDDPRQAVEAANQLVDEVTSRVVETFTRGRAALEEQWSRGDEVTTEDLRVVMQRYRSFFDSLLKTSTAGT